jgi:dTDP-4-amino-4,6-dideoxygalactose transaminase
VNQPPDVTTSTTKPHQHFSGNRAGRFARRHLPVVHFCVDSLLWMIALPTGVVLRYDFDLELVWRREVALSVVVAVTLQGAFGLLYGLYRRRWRYGTFDEVKIVALTALSVGLVLTIGWWNAGADAPTRPVPRSVPLLATGVCVLGQVAIRSMWRLYSERRNRPTRDDVERLVIVGAGEGAELVLRTLRSSAEAPYLVTAMVDDDPLKRNLRLSGIRVEGRVDDLATVARRTNSRTVLIATPGAAGSLFRRVTALAAEAGLRVLVLPPVEQLLGQVRLTDIRPVTEADLVGRNRIFLSPPDVGESEREALLRAFDSGWIAPVGPDVEGFEQELAKLTGWQGAVALSSGTAALHLALLVNGVQPGDDVLVQSLTFAATANAVSYVGARPCFIDSESQSWNMSPHLLREELQQRAAIGDLPAAVVVVDLYGQCADYGEIVPLCSEYGIPLIEDAAEALGATHHGRPAGTLGTTGVFSFNGNKIMTTSGGGALVTPDVSLADRVRFLAAQAREPVPGYHHVEVGYNYRLSNLLAALGRAQLARLPEMSARRSAIHERYREALEGRDGLCFMPSAPWGGGNRWLTCIVFENPAHRDASIAALEAVDIESRPLWKPMHLQPLWASVPARVDGTSERLWKHGLSLPSGSSLTDAQVDRVAAIVAEASA